MSSRKNPGLGARAQAISAAVIAAESTPDGPQWQDEATKGISVRLPLSLYERVSELSFTLRRKRGAEKKKRAEADPLSIHGLMLTALSEYLDRQKA